MNHLMVAASFGRAMKKYTTRINTPTLGKKKNYYEFADELRASF
jgi:hypothetical protein